MSILRAMPKKMPASLIVVMVIISLSIVVVWVGKRDPGPNAAGLMAGNQYDAFRDVPENTIPENQQRIQDCDRWTDMNLREKRGRYRADPERWAKCLCEGEGCKFDRLYITGKVSR